ncbi:MAG: AMP-dependent synthetase [Acidiferrobacteraceae bacterium]|nr:AMP-dependent synthetase [Acidiferrobacteraceae bacterium]|tara:strand:- start:7075 stop:8727 length:1653 start_codon:yes stop_codon:yes gene_type:complete
MSDNQHLKQLTEVSNLVYDENNQSHHIAIPSIANIGADTIGCHSSNENANKTALIYEDAEGRISKFTFRELHHSGIRLALGLQKLGVKRGDAVAIHTGQSPETAIAHIATYYLGGIALTLSQLYGPDTIEHILNSSGCKLIITHTKTWESLRPHRSRFRTLEKCIVTDSPITDELLLSDVFAINTDDFKPEATLADDPALLMYTSGSTGMPKGMLHAHRIIHAYYPTVSMFYNLELKDEGAVFWTPADWAWVGGLLDLVLPAWQAGQTVVASQNRFSADWAFEFMERHNITHSFMTPTALKRLAEVSDPRSKWDLRLRVVCTGGESLPSRVVDWAQHEMSIVCNEFYGLTEFNHMVGNCEALYPIVPGSMGQALPGRTVAIINDKGVEQDVGTVGEIASWRDHDPSIFLGYWEGAKAANKYIEFDWLRSGDLAYKDNDGYFWYQGRNDDLIKSAGYRIGPAEVEDTLVRHHLVAEAAVVGKKDIERGQIVVAFVRLIKDTKPDDSLKSELQSYVKDNLAFYKYPRMIRFVESFPLTSSGKIQRKKLREQL